ncbi:MAG TPA: acyl-CoA dehydrogenase family protein [Segeticoccus sp.]|nr:acyl-CoA dehydrogenase family protein [Segeticoccus sp.]
MRRTVFTEDHEALRGTAHEFVHRSLVPRAEEFLEQHAMGREVWFEAGKQGLLGLGIPEEYGGAGVDDYRFTAVVSEELSKFAAAVSSNFGIHASVVAPYLVELGTEEQKQRWLPRFCTGEIVAGIAMTEPSGGSDLAALRTTAVRHGDDWILNGSKTFITNGYHGDFILVAARTAPEKRAKGITLFAVEAGMPGFERGRKLDKVGQLESDTAELSFRDVRVPAENVVGEVDRGFIHMMEQLPQERVGAAVSNTANAFQIFEETLGYVKERRAFGQPIGTFQHNKFRLAEMSTSLEVTRAYVDDCIAAHAAHELTAVEAAKAKWWSAQVQNDVIDACVQLYGGYGYMNEYRVARAWRDARVTKIWAGSNEIMKELIGRDLGL